jgi:hypothetical protein
MKQKTLLISENTHTKLKKFCNENSIKLNDWVEKLIIEELRKKTSNGE